MAQFNVGSALLNGITIPAGSEIETISATTTVEIAEQVDSGTGEIILADPVNMAKLDVAISGDGPHGLALTAGTVATPATVTKLNVEVSEAPNARCKFSVRATGMVAFTDPATEVEDVGAEPTIADLEIVSVEYAIAESIRRSYELSDKTIPGTDGTPALRATHTGKGSFSISGRGDTPVGVAAGSGGASFKGCATGKVIVSTFGENEKRADWAGWNADGGHYKSVA